MKDGTYQFLIGLVDLFLWSGELIGEENLPQRGPAVFIANHLDATGPIATCCSIPLRLHPWSIGDMMDKEKASTYLNMDFTERQLHLKPPLSVWISRVLTKITVPLFWSLGCIPVYKGDYQQMVETLRLSMDVLRQGKFLLVFPEDATLPANPVTRMSPFQHSFVRLGEKYYQETGQRLEFYPVAVHSKGYVMVGKPVAFDPLNPAGLERHRLKNLMEETVRCMYLEAEEGKIVGALSPEHK
jgi:1-acyl-sn-glycerol-3-phosphate acyltransferase